MRFVIPCRQVVRLLHTDIRLAAGLWAQQHATAAPGARLTLTAWHGDSFGRLERRKMSAPVMSPCSLLLHHFTCPPFIPWIKRRFHKAHSCETRLGNKVNYSVVKGNTMVGEMSISGRLGVEASVSIFSHEENSHPFYYSLFLNGERIII